MIAFLLFLSGAAWTMTGLIVYGFGARHKPSRDVFTEMCKLDWPIAFIVLLFWPVIGGFWWWSARK